MTSPSLEPSQVASLIADHLAALPHPDGGVRAVAGFAAGALMPEPLRDQQRRQAVEVGEAIVHLLVEHGWTISRADSAATPASSPAMPSAVRLHCRHCDALLLSVSLAHGARAVTDGRALIGGIGGLRQECPHGRV